MRRQNTAARAHGVFPRQCVERLFGFDAVLLAILVVFAACAPARAKSAARLVLEGIVAYEAGDFERALAAYDEASVEEPESAQIYFNRGNVFYRLGDYAQAAEAFETAAVRSRDLGLEAKCWYNLGNCAFREAERQRHSDLQKALDACELSIQRYQKARELDPGLHDAERNIEVVRLTMKAILDEISKQAEQAEQQEHAANKLKELIERQQSALGTNEALDKERSEKGDLPQLRNRMRDLTAEQRDIQQQTQELAEQLEQTLQQAAQDAQAGDVSSLQETHRHLEEAVAHQSSAGDKLEGDKLEESRPDQKQALDSLVQAMAAMAEPQAQQAQQGEGQPPPDGDGKEQDSDRQQDQDQEQAQKDQQQQAGDQQERQEEEGEKLQAELADKLARDILQEEQKNRKRRNLDSPGGYQPVDRDW